MQQYTVNILLVHVNESSSVSLMLAFAWSVELSNEQLSLLTKIMAATDSTGDSNRWVKFNSGLVTLSPVVTSFASKLAVFCV